MARTGRPPNKPEVHIASYTKGGRFETKNYGKMAEVLKDYSVNAQEAVIEVTDKEGEERRITAASKLNAGDTVIIMKSKNKSG